MPSKGFHFVRLEAHGRDVKVASLDFGTGLNVISGASDTGKSYLVHCLNFMTGAKEPPKAIPESSGYETLWLEIETWSGETFTLERSLRGKDFRLHKCKINEVDPAADVEELKESRSTGKKRTISQFLLELIGAEGLRLRINAKGEVHSGSFRDFAHLSIINEERIYTEGSPVRATGQFVSKTREESFFRYLLTGIDDSSVISSKDEEETEPYRQARAEAIQQIIESTEDALNELVDAPAEVSSQLEKLRVTIDQTTTSIAVDRDRLRQEQVRRRDLWADIEASTARTELLNRLVNRFALLDEHYKSDSRRLKAMAEAGEYLSQLPLVECPVCGTEDAWGENEDIGQVQRACAAEIQRIEMLRSDLESTVSDIEGQVETLNRGIVRSKRSYDTISQEIEKTLLPAEEVTKEEISQLLEKQVRLEQATALAEQVSRLKAQLEEIRSAAPPASRKRETTEGSQTAASTSETDEFCKVVEKLLGEWKFPETGRVTFSETKQDIVINGKDRASHGKGIRALSYSAFVVGLLRFCRKKKRSHSGIVVLDSPLVAYREPDSQKTVKTANVKENFYRSLAKPVRETQVIIFENEDPPEDVISKITYTHFSGDKTGKHRSGFFPS
ncbi:AAA family ATPase [Anatilimnocola floriformis]|uniref:AAA family ATPase n=1 Tax=Anatilimnocola floriformis TaxID=2948575 RepID=UPI0020C46944|nr:AAA family ATPase [Anatilimnocola floriformis]